MLKQIKSLDILIILAAFLYGNLFAIQNSPLNWSFTLIFFIVFVLEFLSKTFYFLEHNKYNKNFFSYPCIITNTLKRGFLLGFFLEAFKVGS